MADRQQVLTTPATVLAADTSAAGAELAIDVTAGSRTRTYITAIHFSASDAPASATTATLAIAGETLTFRIPAAAYATVFINFAKTPLESALGETVTLTIGAHGGAVLVSAALYGFKLAS